MDNIDNWINDTFKSIKSHQLQTPSLNLFDKIEYNINNESTKIVSIFYLKIAVAICFILLLNFLALKKINNQDQIIISENKSIISDFNIYKNE